MHVHTAMLLLLPVSACTLRVYLLHAYRRLVPDMDEYFADLDRPATTAAQPSPSDHLAGLLLAHMRGWLTGSRATDISISQAAERLHVPPYTSSMSLQQTQDDAQRAVWQMQQLALQDVSM